MTWKRIKLTDAIVDDIALYLGREYLLPGRPGVTTYPPRAETMDAWRIVRAVLSHPDAAGLFADEGATRAAREQGWDDAAEWGYRSANLGHYASERIKAANPHRPVQELPTKAGAQIIPALGAIEAVRNGVTYTTDRAIYDGLELVWVGIWRGEGDHSTYEMPAGNIAPGTWRAV